MIVLVFALVALSGKAATDRLPLYAYTLRPSLATAAYDEAVTVAGLQGLINRSGPELYLLSSTNKRPAYWLDIMQRDGRWLSGRSPQPVAGLDALVRLAGTRLKGAVIWDPAVPATVNVATTAAGVRDLVVLSPEQAGRFLPAWKLPVILDLRNRFTGAETGSRKNDAYRWAVREFLATSACSSRVLCLFHDSFFARAKGDLSYAVTRDWAVRNRAFVFDLSPWGDEKPEDDPDQRLGLDLETYHLILTENMRQADGRHLTELQGFFCFEKYSNVAPHHSRHEPVPTEWESVWQMSPYNAYQNTGINECYNQSLHSQAPRAPLHQAVHKPRDIPLGRKAYLCILMADYDSGLPLYDFLPGHWNREGRGELPLAWGINPNLRDTYPDLVEYFYGTAGPDDTFTADASAAGYMNPNRIKPEQLPLFVAHNRRYFREQDLTIAPMVLDWDAPTPAVKDAFREFAPDGYATILYDYHRNGGKPVSAHVWKGMPVLELMNDACEYAGPQKTAEVMANAIAFRNQPAPGFYFFRMVWISPKDVAAALAELRRQKPDLDFEVLDPATFFALFKQAHVHDAASVAP